MYIVRWSGGSVAFPVKGLQDALKSPHSHTRERAAILLRESYALAVEHSQKLGEDGHKVVVARAGRQSDAKGWRKRRGAKKGTRINIAGELVVQDEAWKIPEGFVDTEADKHGPVITVPQSTLYISRSNAEKAEWFATSYHSNNKTCLWQ